MQMDGFERFGLRKDPFSTVSSEMIPAIEEVHVSLAFDDHLGKIKEIVFGMQQQAMVLLLGDHGAGKTEKLMVAAKEAEMNNVLSVMFSLSNTPKGGIAGLIDQVLISAENNSIGGFFKSSDYLKYLKKVQKNGVTDPGTIGQAIAGLLNDHRPSFLLLDDLDNISEMIDGQPFFSMLTTLLQQLQPGVLVLMTARPSFTNQAAAQNPSFPNLITHTLTIPLLSEQDAEAIITRRIAESRMVDDIGPLYPFSSEAVQVMVQKSRGNPGQLLKNAHELLMAGLQQQSIMIDESIAGLVFSQVAMDGSITSTSDSSDLPSKMQPSAEVWASEETEEETARFEPEVIPLPKTHSTSEQTTHLQQNEEQPIITPPSHSEEEISKQLPDYEQYEPVEEPEEIVEEPEEVEKFEEDNDDEWDEEDLGIIEISEAYDEPKTSQSTSNPATKTNLSDQQYPKTHNFVFDTQTWDTQQLLLFSSFNNKKTPKASSSKDFSSSKKNQATPAATDTSRVNKKKASSKKSSPKKGQKSSPTRPKTSLKIDKKTPSSKKTTPKKSPPKKKSSPSKKESKPSLKKKKQQKKQPQVSAKQVSVSEEVNVQTFPSSEAPSKHRYSSEENVLHSNSMKGKLSQLTSRIRLSPGTGPEHALDYADKVRLLCPECKSTFVIQVSDMTELIHCPHCKFISTIT